MWWQVLLSQPGPWAPTGRVHCSGRHPGSSGVSVALKGVETVMPGGGGGALGLQCSGGTGGAGQASAGEGQGPRQERAWTSEVCVSARAVTWSDSAWLLRAGMRQGQTQGRGQREARGQEAVEGSQARDNWVWDRGGREGREATDSDLRWRWRLRRAAKGREETRTNPISPLSSEATGRRQQREMKARPSVSDS